uniref:Retrovirus-related Pol polyprotein from transposon TNT 1-94 n=1 Tax=Tanacetum cinerariifolium TaxID=118510 RepID=A0A699HMD5_TANCI|nr:retrovirus-related Pol polyprotein from transposon TNT 1-94 [Tanacetum cinerariifolium]
MITQPTNAPLGNNTEGSRSITEPLVLDVMQSYISNQAPLSSHPIPQDRWSRYQHIELVNIIDDPGKVMLTRSMTIKLTATSVSECLFADFLSEIEPKKVSKALKHPGWINTMQEELNQLYRNKVWTLVPFPYGKIAIVYQMDVKSAFLNGKLKEKVNVKQPPGFESSEFLDYVCKLDKTHYGLKQEPKACPKCKISVQSKRIISKSYEKNPQVPKRKLVGWSAKKQQSVAISSAEAENVAAAWEFWSTAWRILFTFGAASSLQSHHWD